MEIFVLATLVALFIFLPIYGLYKLISGVVTYDPELQKWKEEFSRTCVTASEHFSETEIVQHYNLNIPSFNVRGRTSWCIFEVNRLGSLDSHIDLGRLVFYDGGVFFDGQRKNETWAKHLISKILFEVNYDTVECIVQIEKWSGLPIRFKFPALSPRQAVGLYLITKHYCVVRGD